MSDQLYTSNNLTGSNTVTASAQAGQDSIDILVANGPGTLSGSVRIFSSDDNSGLNFTVGVNGAAVSAPTAGPNNSVVELEITTPTALNANDLVQVAIIGGGGAVGKVTATATLT